MWFDVQQALSKIEGNTRPPSEQSPVPATAQPPVAIVATVAALPHPKPNTDAPPPFRHGTAFDGRAKTWTGRIVSLDDWRLLTAWDRKGPDGRHWNGLTRQWEIPKGGKDEVGL